MPDTGAPWNLRYPDVTDLVVDGPEQFEDLADDVATGLSAIVARGIGSNVVQAVKTTAFTTASSSFVDVTDLEVTITPSSATSRILVLANVSISHQESNASYQTLVRLVRGATALVDPFGASAMNGTPVREVFQPSVAFLDSPSTTSPVTYKVQARARSGGQNAYVGRGGSDSSPIATDITAIEVAA